MSEEPKETKPTDDSDFPEPMEGEINEGDEYADEYPGEGFDPMQRRFLWTVTAVLILAMFGAAWLNIYYEQRARAQLIRISELTDEHNAARQQLAQAQNTLGERFLRAYLQGDNQAAEEDLEQLTNVYRAEQGALVNLRNAQDLPAPPVTEERLNQYRNDVFNQLKQRGDAFRQQAAASTQPAASRPSSSSGPVNTGGAPAAPIASP